MSWYTAQEDELATNAQGLGVNDLGRTRSRHGPGRANHQAA
jgi:hypothetical protein